MTEAHQLTYQWRVFLPLCHASCGPFAIRSQKNATIYTQTTGSLLTAIRQLLRILVCICLQVWVIVVLF